MTIEQKLEEIREYLSDRFPNHNVEIASDDPLRYRFKIERSEDLAKSQSLTIPQDAVDDLDSAEIIALLKQPITEELWTNIPGFALHLVYEPVDGINLPEIPNND